MIPDYLPVPRWGPKKDIEWKLQITSTLNSWQIISIDTGILIEDGECAWRTIRLAPWVHDAIGNAAGANGGFKCVRSGNVIRVYFGVVNSIVPDGMDPGDEPPFTITPIGSSGYVVLAVLTADGVATDASIQIKITPPIDADDVYYLLIGSYGTGPGGLTVTPGGDGSGVGDQQFKLCGGVGGSPEFWRA